MDSNDKERLAKLEANHANLADSFKEFKTKFVTRDEFLPVRLIVYGLVAIIGSSILIPLVERMIK